MVKKRGKKRGEKKGKYAVLISFLVFCVGLAGIVTTDNLGFNLGGVEVVEEDIELRDIPTININIGEYGAGGEAGLSTEEVNEIVGYDIAILNQQVIRTAQLYFKDIVFYDFELVYVNTSIMRSYHFIQRYDNGTLVNNKIVMGINDVKDDPELYKTVLTHEYGHYILHRLGLWNGVSHESITETYTWFLNKERQQELWGEDNNGRYPPYDIIMDEILEDNKFECLSKVYDKEDKINEISDITIRTENECGVNMSYVPNTREGV